MDARIDNTEYPLWNGPVFVWRRDGGEAETSAALAISVKYNNFDCALSLLSPLFHA
jgi:hypothetical protein